MRHLTLFFVLSLVTAIAGFAQTGSIQGLVIDSKTTAPIENLAVKVDATDIVVYTNTKGEFLLNNVPAGIGTLIFVGTDFESKELDYKLKSGELLKIGTVSMKTDKKVPEIESEILVIELEDSEVGDDEGASSSSQGVSGLLHSSNDLFSSTAAYTFGTARFRVRGYDQNNSGIFFNGIEMNNIENGRPVWSDWGGLNDAVRNKEISFGGDESSFSLNALGGTANIITRASEYRPGVKVSYMSTNRTYRNRVMATASTGLMENGLAVTLSGSHRWAQEGYIEG
ncbi:MAG: TonB-dependent receptor, partial [Bacteroidales bacterium]|nr:TonB-dependent receptor [Bacteroidales bacterium]